MFRIGGNAVDYELKQNPAPFEWAVLIIESSETRRKIVTVVTFKGENSLKLATDYRDLQLCLQAGTVQIIVPKSQWS